MARHATTGRERLDARHRRADAIAELLTRTIDGESDQPQPTSLLILADYDAIDRQLGNPRLADGTPIPQGEFRKLAYDATPTPTALTSNPPGNNPPNRPKDGEFRASSILGVENCHKPGLVGPVDDCLVGSGQLVAADDCGGGNDAISGVGVESRRAEFDRANGNLVVHRDGPQPVGNPILVKNTGRNVQFESTLCVVQGNLPKRERRCRCLAPVPSRLNLIPGGHSKTRRRGDKPCQDVGIEKNHGLRGRSGFSTRSGLLMASQSSRGTAGDIMSPTIRI